MVANYPVEDSNSILEGHEGIKVTLVYRNVCIPDLFRNQAGVTSKMVSLEYLCWHVFIFLASF